MTGVRALLRDGGVSSQASPSVYFHDRQALVRLLVLPGLGGNRPGGSEEGQESEVWVGEARTCSALLIRSPAASG